HCPYRRGQAGVLRRAPRRSLHHRVAGRQPDPSELERARVRLQAGVARGTARSDSPCRALFLCRSRTMMSRPWHFLLAFLLCAAGGAHAAISCSLGAVSGLATLYDGLASADTLDSGTYVVNCSRTSTSDPASVTFKTNVDAGANAQGSNSRVRL